MDRRNSIKTLVAGGIAGGLLINGCKPAAGPVDTDAASVGETEMYGRTPEEKKRDRELMKEPFFNAHEMATLTVLCDLIIPADDVSGSASDAEVPAFIDFIMKDQPGYQNTMRGGLMWLDHQTLALHDKAFVDCSEGQQTALLDKLAYPEEVEPAYQSGVRFFNTVRNLTATGFFTSKMGVITDLGYIGNVPTFWDGVPQEVLDKHNLAYDEDRMAMYVTVEEREKQAEWDENGNIKRS
ncbi:MAG: gluconate 2-dehydrogenase subunit 3 family protein [Saprospiraceae bacterium]|nr:gluconate 2-dehydrogenase subunit 3 family protein [Saprospiraceae bacterium]